MKTLKKIKFRYIILFLVLLYPFIFIFNFFIGIDYSIAVPYFLFVNLLVIIDLLNKKLSLKFLLGISIPYLLLFIIILINLRSIRYIMPLVFIFVLFINYLYIKSCNNCLFNISLLYQFYFYFIFISVILFLVGLGYTNNRFNGFLLSATTFSSYITLVFLLGTKIIKRRLTIYLSYLVVLIMIIHSGTRLNLVFFLILPLFFLINKVGISKKIVYWIYITILMLVYPAYKFIANLFPSFIYSRYNGKVDASYNLRINLFSEVFNDYFSGTLVQKIFGKGAEYSRLLIKDLHGIDFFPHNDFIRFLNDFGFIALLLLLYVFYKIAIKSNIQVFIAILLYFLMFYSNMIYNLYFLFFIFILYSFGENKRLINKKKIKRETT